MSSEKVNLLPFLKWAGGKRWFTQTWDKLLPEKFNNYIEPFVGSGAVFFHLKPANAILADINGELIETYKALKTDWRLVTRNLRRLAAGHTESSYYTTRASEPKSKFSRAARFIYLNRTCWNGLYRVNLDGQFNVPIGSKRDILRDTDNFKGVSDALKSVELRHSDFELTIGLAKKGDLLFVDPPYTVKHNNNGFVKYNEKMFSWEDQIRLRDCLLKAKERGAHIVVTNAYHGPVMNLYKGNFSMKRLERQSVIAADSANRGRTEELLIRG